MECSFLLLLSYFVENRLEVFCQMLIYTAHLCARGTILKWLNQQPQHDVCVCRTYYGPAGGYRACIQINSMFVYFSFQVRGGLEQRQQNSKGLRHLGSSFHMLVSRCENTGRCAPEQLENAVNAIAGVIVLIRGVSFTHARNTRFGDNARVWK